MAKTKISQFDANAANNTDLNSISVAEGTAPSNINNAIRELMSQLADLNLGNEVLSTLKIDNLHLDGNTIVTLDTNGDLNLTPNGTGAVTIAKVDINGGAIDGTPIGGSSASTGAFTTLSASSTANLGSTVTISGGNIDGVIGANTPAAITGTVITANTNFAGNITGNVTGNVTGNLTGNVTGNVTGDVTGDVTGNITASSGSSTFNNVTINGTLDMDSTTSQTITGLATPSGSTDAATKGYVDTEVSALVDSAPSTLNTLNELAAALGDDASFSTTVTNSIAAKLPLAGGTMTGDINLDSNSLTNLAAPSNNNDAARKAYVDTADALKLNLSGGTLSGDLAMGDNKITGLAAPTADGDAARKKYVDDIAGSGTAAATSASQAATSATNAANSATASANSATAAASSATSAAASYDSFDDRYLGAKSSAPSTDNDGDALVTGALYWNTSSNQLFVWNGSSWTQGSFSSSGFLATGNNLSDVANAGTARTNLGLGTASTLNVGTSANNIPQLDSNGKLPAIDGSQLTNLNAQFGLYGSTSSPITYTVTVDSKTASHPYNGDGSSSAYFINGVESPAIQLQGVDGTTANTEYFYKFDQSHSSNSGHPLRFYKDAAKSEAYTTGVTTNGTAGSSGAYTTIAVDDATPNVLYYQCSSHSYMGNYVTTPSSSVQGLDDAELTALAGLTSAADKGIQFTGSGTAGTYDLTTAGKALLDDADAAAQRTTLGLGTAATTASTDYATAAQGTKADNAAAKASNLSDLASASTARTNLGLGTAATLTAGTSANNAVQLDSNAKLPAVDGSQLTGLASGGSIDMTVGTGSSALTAGTTVTRETNGETKKVELSTTTTNHSLTAADGFASLSDPSDRNSSVQNGADIGASNDGRYLAAFVTQKSSNGQYYYWYLQSFVHDGSGGWTAGTPTQVQSYAEFGTYGHNRRNGNLRVEYLESLNSGDGGTFLVTSLSGAGDYGQYGGRRIMHCITMDSSGAITVEHQENIGSLMVDGFGSPYNSNNDFCSFDYGISSLSGQVAKFVAHGVWARTIAYVGHYGRHFLIEATITYDPSADTYTFARTRRYDSTTSPTSMSSVYASTMCIIHNHDGNDEPTFIVFSQGGNTGTSGNLYLKRFTYSSTDTFSLNSTTSWISSLASSNTGGWRLKAQSGKICGFLNMGVSTSNDTSSKEIKYITASGSTGSVQSAVSNSSTYGNGIYGAAPSGKYDYINDAYVTLGDNAARKGQNNHISSYPISTSDNGSSITVGSATNVSDSSNNEPSKWSYLHAFGFAGASISNLDQTSISGANAGKANRYLYYTTGNYEGAINGYKDGVMDTTTSVTASNKSKFFGFAQESGSAGNTVKVKPLDTEGLETNVSGLTHGTTYYVADNGTLTTSAGTDNPLAGEAIGTGALRLPTKSVASSSGGDSRIFCGSYDFRVDGSSTAQNVLISLPSDYTASNVRSYEINVHGVGFAANGNFLCMLPYNGSSSVYSGSTYNTHTYMNGNSGSATNNSKTQSTAFILNWANGTSYDLYSANDVDNPKQNYDNASGHGGQLTCRAVYTNSLRNGSLMYDASWRYGSGNNHHSRVLSIASASSGASTSDYADGFYFYIGNDSQAAQSTAIMEGVISIYAIIG